MVRKLSFVAFGTLLLATAASVRAQNKPLTNSDVVLMITNKIDDKIILFSIDSAATTAFDVSPHGLVLLHRPTTDGKTTSDKFVLEIEKVAADKQPRLTLTNNDVITMVQGGLSEKVVMAAINYAGSTKFDVSPQGLVNLKLAGVNDDVASRMQELSIAGAAAADAPTPADTTAKRASAVDVATTPTAMGAETSVPEKAASKPATTKADWKKQLRAQLESAYPLTKIKFTNLMRQINDDGPHGVVLVTQRSGLRIDRPDHQPTNLIDEAGKLHGPGVMESLDIAKRALHDDSRYDPGTDGTMGAGERVYVTNITVGDDHVGFTIQTARSYSYDIGIKANEHSPVDPHTETVARQFVALVQFRFPREVLMSADLNRIVPVIDQYLLDVNNPKAFKSSEPDLTGKTVAEVVELMGDPTQKVTLGKKTTYIYPRMKVVFVDGKVSDIQ